MTKIFVPEDPPLQDSEEGRALNEYIARQHRSIEAEFNTLEVGRAGLDIIAPISSTTLLTQTPQKITGYDAQLLPEVRARSNLANSTIIFNASGLWTIAFAVVANIVAHNANYARGAVVQLYNETDAVSYKILDFASVARYQDLIKFSISYPVYVTPDILGKEIAIYAYTTTANSIQFTGVQLLEYTVILQVEY